MSQCIDLKDLERRAYRESVQDGIMEILLGFFLAVSGTILLADSKLTGIFMGVSTIIVLAFMPRILERAKRRLTYPRLGKVVPTQEKPKPLFAGILLYALAAGALVALGLAFLGRLTTAEWYRWLPVWIGLCFVGACWHLYSKSARLRYLAYALVALGSGVAVGSLRLPSKMDNIAVYFICMGALSALTGAIMLIRFLRNHPLAPQQVRDENSQS